MRTVTAIAIILATNAFADTYDRYEYRSPRSERRQSYGMDPGVNRQMEQMTARINYIQPKSVEFQKSDRLRDFLNKPIVETEQAKKPEGFLSYLGNSIKQIPAQIGRAMMAVPRAIAGAVQWAINKVASVFGGPVKAPALANSPPRMQIAMSTITSQRPVQNINIPSPIKATVISIPDLVQKPQHNITVPLEIPKTQNIHMPDPQRAGVLTKGGIGGLIDKARQLIGLPVNVPTNKLYHDPNPKNDFDMRGGMNDPNTVEKRLNQIRGGYFETIKVIETQKGYAVSDGHHRWEAAQKLKMPTVPVKIIGREK